MRLSVLLCLLFLFPALSFAGSPRILFDQGHRQAFLIEKEGPLQLSNLANLFQQQGFQIGQSTAPLSKENLTGVDALVISGAFSPLQPAEIDEVLGYLQRGGKLAIMIHIGQPFLPLLHKLGVDVGTRVINEKQNQTDGKTIDFAVTNFKPHPLTQNLDSFVIYGGWPLQAFGKDGKAIASSSVHSWVDMNNDKRFSQGDVVSPFDVLISGDYGRGSFVVFADDAIFQNQFLHAGNEALAKNLARWLKANREGQVEI